MTHDTASLSYVDPPTESRLGRVLICAILGLAAAIPAIVLIILALTAEAPPAADENGAIPPLISPGTWIALGAGLWLLAGAVIRAIPPWLTAAALVGVGLAGVIVPGDDPAAGLTPWALSLMATGFAVAIAASPVLRRGEVFAILAMIAGGLLLVLPVSMALQTAGFTALLVAAVLYSAFFPVKGPCEAVATGLIAFGTVLLMQPIAIEFYAWSLAVTLLGTVMFIITSHFPQDPPESHAGGADG